ILTSPDVTTEKRLGLHSILTIICKECNITSAVHTGKIQKSNDQRHAENNLTVVLGSTHSGTSCTGLKKLFACMDIPGISTEMYKRYEQVIGPFVEEAAKDSCKRSAKEERRLVLENIEKICQRFKDNSSFHDAEFDVAVLQKLALHFKLKTSFSSIRKRFKKA
ncbi:hypothetical protein X777_04175, partial [Ooceraea biroi]